MVGHHAALGGMSVRSFVVALYFEEPTERSASAPTVTVEESAATSETDNPLADYPTVLTGSPRGQHTAAGVP